MRRSGAVVSTGLAAVLLAACGAGAPRSSPTTTTTATPRRPSTPTSTTGSTAGSATVRYAWSRAILPALGGGPSATISAVLPPAESGGYWSVVGTVTAADGSTTARIWLSHQGRHWRTETLGGVDGQALAATGDGAATVVVGSVGTGRSQRAAVWMTPPGGGTPEPVADQASLRSAVGSRSTAPAGASEMDRVAAGTIGIVAAGSVAGRAAVWYSSDGSDWSQEPSIERLVAARRARLTSLLVDPDGALATGVARDGTDEVGVTWDSADGIRWKRDPSGALSPPGDHVVTDVTWTGRELVAVGGSRASSSWSPAAWVSPGVGAASASVGDFPSGSGALRAVSVDPTMPDGADAIVAVGGPAGRPQAFESAKGETWRTMSMPSPAAGDGSVTADLVATWGATTVVADSQPGQPLVWFHRSSGWSVVAPATFGGLRPTAEPVAIAETAGRLWLAADLDRPGRSPGTETVILDSVDGRRWSPASVLPRTRLTGLAAAGDGHLIATGVDERTGRSAVWTSGDGRAWRPTSTLGATASPTAIASFAGAPVALGTTPLAGRGAPTATAWRPDGSTTPTPRALEATPSVDPVQPLGLCSDAASGSAPTSTSTSTSTSTGSGSATGTSGSAKGTRTLVAVGWSTRTAAPPTASRPRSDTTSTIPVVGSGAGTAGQESDGTEATAWWSVDGVSWSPGTITPRPGVGSDEEMIGCAATPGGFVAWGQAPGAGGPQPALWTSTDATSWTRVLPAGRGRHGGAPVGPGGPWTSVALSGPDWLAVGGDPPTALALPSDPAWSTVAGDPLAPGVTPTAYGTGGVWLSTDSGGTWQLLSADTSPWSGSALSTTVAAWAGSSAVVAGDVGGALAVWVGRTAGGR